MVNPQSGTDNMGKKKYRIISTILLVAILFLPLSVAVATEITVAAANSTCGVLKKAGEIFSRQEGVTIHYICKSSGVLAKGLQSGYITADYYISASQKWMDYLSAARLIDPKMVKPLWDNRIVAAVAKKSGLELHNWDELATAKVTTVLVGDPSTTPNGRQFKNAMVSRGLWQGVRGKIVAKRHMALIGDALMSANDTTIGIMFPTSLGNQLKSILGMPTEWHDPIRYYAAPLLGSKKKQEIASYGTFLRSEEVNKLFRQKGYIILP